MKPRDKNARLEKALKRLGTRNPSCVACGEADPLCLELHHIGEKDHHDDLSIVCRNCHRKLSDPQKDLTEVNQPNPTLETIGRYLHGLAELFLLIAETLKAFGNALLGLEDADAVTP